MLQRMLRIRSPLAGGAKIFADVHVRGQAAHELADAQHKEEVRRELLHCHLLDGAIRIKGIHPAAVHWLGEP